MTLRVAEIQYPELTQLATRKFLCITYRACCILSDSFMGDYGFFSHFSVCFQLILHKILTLQKYNKKQAKGQFSENILGLQSTFKDLEFYNTLYINNIGFRPHQILDFLRLFLGKKRQVGLKHAK